MTSYNYLFQCNGRQLEIVTDTISSALESLRYHEPRLQFDHLQYFISMKTGAKTIVFDKYKKIIDKKLEMV